MSINNGQSHKIEQHVCEICCGKCGAPLMQGGNSVAEAYKIMYHQHDQLAQQMKYCPHCGEKVDFDTVIDLPASEITLIRKEEQQPVKTENEENEPK